MTHLLSYFVIFAIYELTQEFKTMVRSNKKSIQILKIQAIRQR
jgi:hypothetical protein